jgi:predicted negative regulator of RcsB-dependent stress response
MCVERDMSRRKELEIYRGHKCANIELIKLNREMALQMIVLAKETGDIEPLIEAVKALRATEALYTPDTTPINTALLQQKLGDVLLNIGKREHNLRALEYSVQAYRGAITIASLLGEEKLRAELRKSYALALNYSGMKTKNSCISLMGAA